MDEVFTLTNKDNEYRTEEFLISSKNIYDIIDKMFEVGYCNIEDFNNNSIKYKEWRNK